MIRLVPEMRSRLKAEKRERVRSSYKMRPDKLFSFAELIARHLLHLPKGGRKKRKLVVRENVGENRNGGAEKG